MNSKDCGLPDWAASLAGIATLGALLRRQAERFPERDALVWLEDGAQESTRLSYSGLDRRAAEIAFALQAEGLAGSRVLLVHASGLELVAALFGCLYAGAVPVIVPLPVSKSLAHIAPLAADSGAAALLCDSATLAPSASRGHLPEGLRILRLDDFALGGGRLAPVADDPQAIALLQYTSGSTSLPRGVMLTHANVMANLRAIACAVPLPEGSCSVSWLPLAHDMGLFGFVLSPIFHGMRSVLMPPHAFLKRPLRWLEAIGSYGAGATAGPSFAYEICTRTISHERRATLDLSSLQFAICGGESVRAGVLEQFAAAFAVSGFRAESFRPAYGLAETCLLASMVPPDERFADWAVDGPNLADGRVTEPESPDRHRSLVACGRTYPGHELAIVEPESRTRLANGRVGEIWLRGPSVARGYWNRPEETAACFGATLADEHGSGGWLRTGDLGLVGPQGVFVTGRRKDLIIIRGMNFDPQDIEAAAANAHPAIAAAGSGAFSIDDATGERVVLALELPRRLLRDCDPTDIAAGVASAMSLKFGLTLHDLVFVAPASLPRTTSGKIQRHLCRERYARDELHAIFDLRHPAFSRYRPAAKEVAS